MRLIVGCYRKRKLKKKPKKGIIGDEQNSECSGCIEADVGTGNFGESNVEENKQKANLKESNDEQTEKDEKILEAVESDDDSLSEVELEYLKKVRIS